MKPTLSFIYVNFRSAQALERSLAALMPVAEAQLEAEYIVVNNDSLERATIDQLQQRVPQLQVIHREHNDGFGQANNAGSRIATGDILFFINPDTELVTANFHGLKEVFRHRPRAILGMTLLQSNGRREAWSAGPFPTLFNRLLAHSCSALLSRPWETTRVTPVDWVSGAACALPRNLFEELGGFDENFFLYFEDVDLAKRAKRTGAWVGLYPFIQLRHHGGLSHASFLKKKAAYVEGQKRYFAKWRPKLEQALLSIGQSGWQRWIKWIRA